MDSLRIVLLFALVILTDASSSASPSVIGTSCDVDSPLWGCDPANWINGDRKHCSDTTHHMGWANAPVNSTCYVLTSGEEESPSSSYIPGAYTYINLRVTCYRMAFRGILLYAVSANGSKIGDWYVTAESPAVWKEPWINLPGHSCERSLMHASAAIKPYFSRFRFLGPVNGTGTITFKALIKQGDANTGAFFKPAKVLMLTEGRSTKPIWSRTDLGQSCQESCISKGLVCDKNALSTLNDPSTFNQVVVTQPCNLPLLNTSIDNAGYYDPATEFCYYGNTVSCDSKSSNSERICACTQSDALLGDASGSISLQARSNLGLVPLMLATLFCFFSKAPKASVFFLLLLAAFEFSSVSAHNWINSNSRSLGANTYAPCKPSRSGLPHAQVGPGQSFAIEWMVAHGLYPTWFGIVSANNSDKLIYLNDDVMQDYINKAPSSAFTDATAGIYQKFYKRNWVSMDSEAGVPSPPHAGFVADTSHVTDFYLAEISPNDTLYIERPNAGSKNGLVEGTFYQYQYKTPELSADVRVSYRSSVYPWLEAVYKFEVIGGNQFDTANFFIPGFDDYGRYIVRYSWGGYLDCVDVDYVSQSVANVYGTAPTTTRWARIDHCLLEGIYYLMDGISEQLTGDVDHCKQRCLEDGTGNCGAVQAAPMTTPMAYHFLHAADGSNWTFPNYNGNEILFPWKTPYWGPEDSTHFWDVVRPENANKTVCYFGKARDYTTTADQFVISDDPSDPVFYGTCWLLNNDNTFPGYEDSGQYSIDVKWRFGDKCVDCDDVATNRNLSALPQWHISNKCVNCDMEPGKPKIVTVPQTFMIAANSTCDGLDPGWNTMYTFPWKVDAHHSCSSNNETAECFKNLAPLGRQGWYYSSLPAVTFDECAILVSKDPDCSSTFMYETSPYYGCRGCMERKVNPSSCICYTKKSCCKNCSLIADRSDGPRWNLYETTTKPDPTCSTGVRSSDGHHCCSASCGAGNCTQGNIYQPSTSIGMCDHYGVTRSCTRFGPPCVIN